MLASKSTKLAPRASAASINCSSTRMAARTYTMSSRAVLSSWDDSRQTSWSLQQTMPRGAAVGPRRQAVTMMGNKAVGGPFAPLVVVVRNIVGDKDFNKLRGKAISLHSQVIKDALKLLGVDNKQVQGVIRLAKKNGEKLGFLA